MAWLVTLHPVLSHSIVASYLLSVMILGGLVLVKARISPLWVFLLLVPLVNAIAIWMFAYRRWPRDDRAEG